MTKNIHVLERTEIIKKIEGQIHECGFWKLTPEAAESLIGGDIYFHKKQKEPSFFGGKILGFRVHEEEDERHGRIVFRFEYSGECRNVQPGAGGWSNQMKIV